MAWNELAVILLIYIVPVVFFFVVLYAVVRKAVSDGVKDSLKSIAIVDRVDKCNDHEA